MDLTLPLIKVRRLQAALQAKAKESPNYRFYALYDKVYRADVLAIAYARCEANHGRAGVDGQTFADIEEYGRERWLGELAQELQAKTYRPQAVRRAWIPKADGKQRPLGIPTIRDRVVQMAAVLVLEPIFEPDLPPEQYAYRAERSAQDAVRAVQSYLDRGYTEVVDADLSGYFDSIPHAELMKSVARRVSDRQLLHLLKMWLEAPVEETDAHGRMTRTTRNKDEHRGTPQGGVVSPLLANLYMRRFVVGWKQLGHEQRLDAHIVNYADDFVILTRRHAAEAMAAMRDAFMLVAGGDVYVCQLHVWRAHFVEDGPEVSCAGAGFEECPCDLSRDQRGDVPSNDVSDRCRTSGPAEPDAGGLGALLSDRLRYASLAGRAAARLSSAALVVTAQAQGACGPWRALSRYAAL
jgi:RNA-directed DNA polymerase